MENQYEDYEAADFALDASFQRWVLDEDPQAAAFWTEWLHRNPHQREAVEEAQKLLMTIRFQPYPVPEDLMPGLWEQIRQRTGQGAQVPAFASGPAPRLVLRPTRADRPWQRLAAVFAGILLVSVAAWLFTRNTAPVSYRTAAGQLQSVRLPDGTRVVLNGASTLRLGENWQQGRPREVWLDGEAFFDVTHAATPANRFVVHVRALEVEVLGTSFNVWQRNGQAKVVLQTGKVQLTGRAFGRPLSMQPGEMVDVTGRSSGIVHRRVDTRLYTSWRRKRLEFNETPMREVAEVIYTRYGYQVQFADSSSAGEQLVFHSDNDDFALLLRLLSESFEVQVDQATKQITIGELPAKQ